MMIYERVSMRVDLFCESGSEYGLGHFYRCLKLIILCAKIPQVSAITLHHRGDFVPKNIHSLLPCKESSVSIDFKHYEWLATQPENLDMVFIDSYQADIRFYHQMSYHAKVLICLDDEFKDIYPSNSYILNGTPNAQFYYPKNQQILAGAPYALLPLVSETEKQKPRQPPTQILITMGGVDSSNFTQKLLDEWDKNPPPFSESHLSIVLGGGYPHTLHIPSSLQDSVEVHFDLSPAQFIATATQCHLAISAGGGSMIELIALKIPSIILQTASNQAFQIAQWASIGAIIPAQNVKEIITLLPTLQSAYDDISSRLDEIQIGSQLLPTLQQIAQEIETQYTQESYIPHNMSNRLESIDFTTLSEKDSDFVLTMRNHPQIAPWMYSNAVSKESHLQFIANLYDDKAKRYWLLKLEGEIIGVGSLTRINFLHRHAYIGIYKNPFSSLPYKGKQILNFLESQAFDVLNLHTLHLEVLAINKQAIAFYENMGYIKEGILNEFIRRDNRYYDVILMYKKSIRNP